MDFGFNIPTRGPQASAPAITAIAQRAEALGYATLAVNDHVVVPRDIASRYPYSEDGQFPSKVTGAGEFLETLSLMAFLAAITNSARLLTSVMVVPHRPAILAAKMLATIDVLSGGRVTVGCGVGWMREEFEALGLPPFAERGKVTDEYIAAFRELWTNDNPSFDGDYVKFSDIIFLPRPLQKAGPPIWTGGESGPALRRAARLADGWYPIGINPRHPLDTVARYAAKLAEMQQMAEGFGRDPAAIALGYWAPWYRAGATHQTDSGERRLFTGSDDDVIGDIAGLAGHGVSHVLVSFVGGTLDDTLERMERFATDIIPRAGG